ncbi:GTP 3',8-cyclase MoaA [Pyrococcus horikoshii]|uniref:Probable GTP 3',8-cyclase n=2 Tax=Pyrococcus horikoshii TaxID=53953 RepID=MOAA_PYRHO|nr:GTP 3',8-cyclase MoaA [Pyrococcus horikoshii]O57854.2 RecName: Full=Probable GTP 3',8-cyclase; AltName: Full=Molybdenum cofactor biosynthesis protein A [Pyrococcus horikoshii OT3]HII61533.1 GTP 3',8-cyclase MoaA [Pyrococcus horikoshii]
MLIDRFGRPVTNLRISLTKECNLSCFYCHREGQLDGERFMTPEEIERIVRVASRLGIKKVKLTGGEPTIRKDILEIIRRLKPYVVDLSLTTNGTTMYVLAEKLKEAGLDRVNISLDTLDRKKYKMITGFNVLDEVIKGIKKATKLFYPVKLNMVVMKGVNDDEIWDMMRFAGEVNAILQLIELEVPREMENSQFFKDFFYPLKPLEEKFEKLAVKVKERRMHRRRKYFIPIDGKIVEVEVVRSMHNTVFCMNCTRLRLTADGYLKTCLLRRDDLIDILGPLRNGASDADLIEIFKRAVLLRRPYWTSNSS